MTTPVSLYITAPSHEEALLLARELLEHKLIACANIIDNASSLYWWQGEIEHTKESVIMAKSFAHHVRAITDKVKALHSYDCPCVISTPIADGNDDYIAWLHHQLNVTPRAS